MLLHLTTRMEMMLFNVHTSDGLCLFKHFILPFLHFLIASRKLPEAKHAVWWRFVNVCRLNAIMVNKVYIKARRKTVNCPFVRVKGRRPCLLCTRPRENFCRNEGGSADKSLGNFLTPCYLLVTRHSLLTCRTAIKVSIPQFLCCRSSWTNSDNNFKVPKALMFMILHRRVWFCFPQARRHFLSWYE